MDSNIKTYTLEFVNNYILHVENVIKITNQRGIKKEYQSKIEALTARLNSIHNDLATLITDIETTAENIYEATKPEFKKYQASE